MLYLVAEIVLFVLGVRWIGLGYTVLALAGVSVVGGMLLSVLGGSALRAYREAVAAEEPPGPAVVSGTIGVVGALLMLVPGFLSGLAGLLCVLPPTRFLLRPLVIRFLQKRADSPSFDRWFGPRRGRTVDGDVVDGEVVDPEPVDEPPRLTGGGRGDGDTTHPGDDDGPRQTQ